MRISLILLSKLLSVAFPGVPGLLLAQNLEWKPPGQLALNCTVLKQCIIGEPCEPFRGKTLIENNPEAGVAVFFLPTDITAKGVIGMVTHNGRQTLLGSATADASLFFRVTVFDDGNLTIQTSNENSSLADITYYGTCRNDSI